MADKISIIKCSSYNIEEAEKAVFNLISNLGGIESFIKKNDKIFLKLNLLNKKPPEAAVNTHPAIVEAVVKLIQKAGGIVTIGDSPGGQYTVERLKAVYQSNGLIDVSERTGCSLNYDLGSKNISFPGKSTAFLNIINPFFDSDKIICISKLKTHILMRFTGAVKLNYGLIPGLLKSDYHFRMSDEKDFSNLLVDIYEFSKPTLNIMDAVIGQEGNGPQSGNPRYIGCLIAGTNGHAVDTVASTIIGLEPTKIPTIQRAVERGLFDGKLDSIYIKGVSPLEIRKSIEEKESFKKASEIGMNFIDGFHSSKIGKFIEPFIKPRPQVINSKCVGCGECFKACPASTIEIVDKKAVIYMENCIRCYCCHELCPYDSIDIKKPVLSKIIQAYFKR